MARAVSPAVSPQVEMVTKPVQPAVQQNQTSFPMKSKFGRHCDTFPAWLAVAPFRSNGYTPAPLIAVGVAQLSLWAKVAIEQNSARAHDKPEKKCCRIGGTSSRPPRQHATMPTSQSEG